MSMPRKLAAGASALLFAVALCGCEKQRVDRYEPGKYSGAPVTAPWDSPHFGGKKADWEAALQVRAQNQNDYRRAPAK
jgi:hypothetical protein